MCHRCLWTALLRWRPVGKLRAAEELHRVGCAVAVYDGEYGCCKVFHESHFLYVCSLQLCTTRLCANNASNSKSIPPTTVCSPPLRPLQTLTSRCNISSSKTNPRLLIGTTSGSVSCLRRCGKAARAARIAHAHAVCSATTDHRGTASSVIDPAPTRHSLWRSRLGERLRTNSIAVS